jgi:three-Cys-motif partner protein
MTCVAIPNGTLWPLDPHTAAKHKILAGYLDAWFPTQARYSGCMVYLDGFSGPGRYSGGEPGSPLIALQSALVHSTRVKEVVLFFIEEKYDRADHLEAEVAKWKLPSRFVVNVGRGEFASRFATVLDRLDQSSLHTAPTFAIVDPLGFSGLPYALMRRLLSHQKCEVLITFRVESIHLWLTSPDANFTSHIAEMFGTSEAAALASSLEPIDALKQLYFSQLKKLARFVRHFEMRDDEHRVVYHLFFASNNSPGHRRMKEVMWKAGPDGEFRFSDATDPAKPVPFDNPQAEDLAVQIATRFRGIQKIAVSRIETFVNDDTAYLRKHMTKALKHLEMNSLLKAEPIKPDGKKRMPEAFSNEVLVSIH